MNITVAGPFVGELLYEACYFAPQVIYQKLKNPKMKLAVFTCEDRIDLYGIHADLFLKSNIDKKCEKYQRGWRCGIFSKESQIKTIDRAIIRKLGHRYENIDFISPDIFGYKSMWLWQCSRDEMCYDFQPYKKNSKFFKHIINEEKYILSEANKLDVSDKKVVLTKTIQDEYNRQKGTTLLGVMIEAIKNCSIYVGVLKSVYTRLAMLMGKPIVLFRYASGDSIYLANPKRVPVVLADNADEGIKIYYENYI